jgi:hypothetical protein
VSVNDQKKSSLPLAPKHPAPITLRFKVPCESHFSRHPKCNRLYLTGQKKTKTYNRRDSQMVTHSSTSRPVQCLCMAERTGCPVLTDLWSYVLVSNKMPVMKIQVNCAVQVPRRPCSGHGSRHLDKDLPQPYLSYILDRWPSVCNVRLLQRAAVSRPELSSSDAYMWSTTPKRECRGFWCTFV